MPSDDTLRRTVSGFTSSGWLVARGRSTLFAFTHLAGIQLMPRIRNWKDLRFYRPEKGMKLIEPLETLQVTN